MPSNLALQDSPGYKYQVLPGGLVKATLEEFKVFFGRSDRRELIVDHYLKFREKLDPLLPNATHLIDGSFVESKKAPSDLDSVIMFDAEEYDNYPSARRNEILKLIGTGNDSKQVYMTDAFGVPLAKPDNKLYSYSWARTAYWLPWFGTSRGGTSKGIIRLLGSSPRDALSQFLANSGMEILP